MPADRCAVVLFSEMLPDFWCVAVAVQRNRALLHSAGGQGEKKLHAPRSGCLLIRGASDVSPAAARDSSVHSSLGERGVDASD